MLINRAKSHVTKAWHSHIKIKYVFSKKGMTKENIKKFGGFSGIAGIIIYIFSIVSEISLLHTLAAINGFNLLRMLLIFILLISFTIFAFLGKKKHMIFCLFTVFALSIISIYSAYTYLLDFTVALRDTAIFDKGVLGGMPEFGQNPYRLILSVALKPFLPTALLSIFYIIFTLKFFKPSKFSKYESKK